MQTTVPIVIEQSAQATPPPIVPPIVMPADSEPRTERRDTSIQERRASAAQRNFVQAVLSPNRKAVIASGIDAKITNFNFKNGDLFQEGDVLITYDCALDHARLKEARSRARVTEKQLIAFEKLKEMESISDIEYVVGRENNEQNMALVSQIQARLKACRHTAPFDGRVTNKLASQYEYVQTGRVLMEIASSDPLRAEFLIPSIWLRWLNIGTPLEIYISETDRSYRADIVGIHGEVDPVSQSIQVVAEMESYHEELLPGMSGRAQFSQRDVSGNRQEGFLGLLLKPAGVQGDGRQTP